MTTTLKGEEHTIWSSNTTTLRQVLIIVLYGSKVRKKIFFGRESCTNRIVGRIVGAIKIIACKFSIK